MQGGPARRRGGHPKREGGAKKAPNSRAPTTIVQNISHPKKERDAKMRKCSYPAGCCIPMVLHRCGPRNVNVHYPKTRACRARARARETTLLASYDRPRKSAQVDVGTLRVCTHRCVPPNGRQIP